MESNAYPRLVRTRRQTSPLRMRRPSERLHRTEHGAAARSARRHARAPHASPHSHTHMLTDRVGRVGRRLTCTQPTPRTNTTLQLGTGRHRASGSHTASAGSCAGGLPYGAPRCPLHCGGSRSSPPPDGASDAANCIELPPISRDVGWALSARPLARRRVSACRRACAAAHWCAESRHRADWRWRYAGRGQRGGP